MSWKLILFLISLAIDWFGCYLFRNNIYLREDNKPYLSVGFAIIIAILSFLICLVPVLNIIVAIGIVIVIIMALIETSYTNGEVKFEFKSEFFKELFTR